ncbi:hypothetical protein [Microbacterium sp. MYb62]|uniref:hypothetical protein n=1 Tax=Microbacterium sp. MYb62 TaxID=1848690 RepID=UPI000D4B5156|nr:hypothetical protein [Microbacterium sp. MYb62]PRB13476.1 hypothetical protein CQ042_13540 [Microbacterium sp. MYb62]
MLTKKRRTALLIAGATAVVLTAVAITAAGVASAEAAETERLCTVSTERAATTTAAAGGSLSAADEALAAVQVLDLPDTDGWTSAAYADRGGADAVQATETAPAVAARPSAAELTTAVTDARTALDDIVIPTTCDARDEAADIVASSKVADTAIETLNEHVAVLAADFAAFQVAETARIAAEIEAARIAAEQEAARLAAEEAERQRAAEEAARRQARSNNDGGTGDKGSSNPSSSGGSKPSGPPPGGQVGDGNNNGVSVCDNGMGGTRPC